MIDPRILRSQPEVLAASLQRRGIELDLESLVALDERRRAERVAAEGLRAEQKNAGKAISQAQGNEREAAIARAG